MKVGTRNKHCHLGRPCSTKRHCHEPSENLDLPLQYSSRHAICTVQHAVHCSSPLLTGLSVDPRTAFWVETKRKPITIASGKPRKYVASGYFQGHSNGQKCFLLALGFELAA